MIRILAIGNNLPIAFFVGAGIGRFVAGRAEALPQNQDCKSFAAVVATVHAAGLGCGYRGAGKCRGEGEGGYGENPGEDRQGDLIFIFII